MKKNWVDMLEPINNCEDAVGEEVERVHPADRPDMLKALSQRFGKWADDYQRRNERDGVPER